MLVLYMSTGPRIPANKDGRVLLGTPAVATIMVLDDDHAGIVRFESKISTNHCTNSLLISTNSLLLTLYYSLSTTHSLLLNLITI